MTTKDNIIALINEANALSIPLNANSVTFAQPVQEGDVNHNTRIDVMATPNSGYRGHVVVRYNRIALADAAPSASIFSEVPFTFDDIVGRLNQHPVVPLEPGDVEPVILPDLQVGSVITIPLQAKDSSLGWNGMSEVTLMFGLPPNVDDLYDIMNRHIPQS